MDYFSNTAGVDMLQQVFNHLVLVSQDVRNDLFLFSVDQELHNFAEVTSKDWVDWLVTLNFDEFKEAVQQHVFAHLLAVVGIFRHCCNSRGLSCCSLLSRFFIFDIGLLSKGRFLLLFWSVSSQRFLGFGLL